MIHRLNAGADRGSRQQLMPAGQQHRRADGAMAARLRSRLLLVFGIHTLLLCGMPCAQGAEVAAAAGTAAEQCRPQAKSYSVLYGMQPVDNGSGGGSSGVHYWDRTASGLKVGRVRQLSVYYDAANECVAGLRLTYGGKPGTAHLMGTERGPGFVERLLLLNIDETVSSVDVMYDSRCIRLLRWHTDSGRSVAAGSPDSSDSVYMASSQPVQKDWQLVSVRGTYGTGTLNSLQFVWGTAECHELQPAQHKAAAAKHTAAKPAAAGTGTQHSAIKAAASSQQGSSSSSGSKSKAKHSVQLQAGAGHKHTASSAQVAAKRQRVPAPVPAPQPEAEQEEATAEEAEADTAEADAESGEAAAEEEQSEAEAAADAGPDDDSSSTPAAPAPRKDTAQHAAAPHPKKKAAQATTVKARATAVARSKPAARQEVAAPEPPAAEEEEQEEEEQVANDSSSGSADDIEWAVDGADSGNAAADSDSTPPAASDWDEGNEAEQQEAQQMLPPPPARKQRAAPAKSAAPASRVQHKQQAAVPAAAAAKSAGKSKAQAAKLQHKVARAADGAAAAEPDNSDDADVGAAMAAHVIAKAVQELRHKQQQPSAAAEPAAAAEEDTSVSPDTDVSELLQKALNPPELESLRGSDWLPAGYFESQDTPAAPAHSSSTQPTTQQQLQQQQQQVVVAPQEQQPPAFAAGAQRVDEDAPPQASALFPAAPRWLPESPPPQNSPAAPAQASVFAGGSTAMPQQAQQGQQGMQQQQQHQGQQTQAAQPTNTAGNAPSGISPMSSSKLLASTAFRAVVPPVVACTPVPERCNTQRGLGEAGFCAAVSPLTQPECVGGCCASMGRCGSNSCVLSGLGADVAGLRCSGLNNGLGPDAGDGSLCQNLGCRLTVPGCQTATAGGGVGGGTCVGKVVALGALAKSHPAAIRFLGYPCLDLQPAATTLNIYGERADKGYYLAGGWGVCNCNDALPSSVGHIAPVAPSHSSSSSSGSSSSSLAAGAGGAGSGGALNSPEAGSISGQAAWQQQVQQQQVQQQQVQQQQQQQQPQPGLAQAPEAAAVPNSMTAQQMQAAFLAALQNGAAANNATAAAHLQQLMAAATAAGLLPHSSIDAAAAAAAPVVGASAYPVVDSMMPAAYASYALPAAGQAQQGVMLAANAQQQLQQQMGLGTMPPSAAAINQPAGTAGSDNPAALGGWLQQVATAATGAIAGAVGVQAQPIASSEQGGPAPGGLGGWLSALLGASQGGNVAAGTAAAGSGNVPLLAAGMPGANQAPSYLVSEQLLPAAPIGMYTGQQLAALQAQPGAWQGMPVPGAALQAVPFSGQLPGQQALGLAGAGGIASAVPGSGIAAASPQQQQQQQQGGNQLGSGLMNLLSAFVSAASKQAQQPGDGEEAGTSSSSEEVSEADEIAAAVMADTHLGEAYAAYEPSSYQQQQQQAKYGTARDAYATQPMAAAPPARGGYGSGSYGSTSQVDTDVSAEGTFIMPGAPPDPPRGRRAAGAARAMAGGSRRAAVVGTASQAPHSTYISNRAYSNQRLSAPSAAAAVAAAAPAAAGSGSSSSSTSRPMASAEAQGMQQQQQRQQQQRRRRHVRGGLSVQSADESDYDEQPTAQPALPAKQS